MKAFRLRLRYPLGSNRIVPVGLARRSVALFRFDAALTKSVGVGVLLAATMWSLSGWTLPSSAAEAASLAILAAKVWVLLSFVAAVVVVPRILAWLVLRRRVGSGWQRTDADGPNADLTSREWWRVDHVRKEAS